LLLTTELDGDGATVSVSQGDYSMNILGEIIVLLVNGLQTGAIYVLL